MNMNLTAEEIALIEQKRAEEKAKLASYDHHRERTIEREVERMKVLESDEERRKARYEEVFNKLIRISEDFKLSWKKNDKTREIALYDVDDNGREIRYVEVNGENEWLEPKEVVKLKTYDYQIKLSYTGKMPKDYEYEVVVIDTYSKYSYRVTGYKLQIRGTGINSWDKRGQMTNPKTVHTKLVELCDGAFKTIEWLDERKKKEDRITSRFKLEFSKYENVEIDNNTFIVTLDNGIKVTFYGYEHGDEITFSSPKISLPYNKIEIKDLLDNLGNIKGKE